MKKLLSILICCCMFFSVLPAFADVADDIEAGEAMTHDELVAKAQAETGTFIVYGKLYELIK